MYSTLFRIAVIYICFACSTVIQAATWTTTTLTVTPASTPTSPTAAGANVKLAAIISSGEGIPQSGSTSFYHGTTLIGTVDMKGTSPVILNTKMLPVGNLQLKAVFNANTKYDTSESKIIPYLVVGGATTTVLSSSMNPANYGTSVTLTATVAGAAPPDTVMFYDGLKLMGTSTVTTGGIATFSISNLAIGSHNLSASYSGSSSLAPSTSPPFTQTIKTTGGDSGITTTTVVTTSSSSVPTGTPVTLTAIVTGGTPKGTVTFYDGSTALGTKNITNGIATLETSTLTEGPHIITVIYHGSATHQVSTSSTLSQTITPVGGGSGSGSANTGGGSCGIGSGLASMVLSLLLMLSLCLHRVK